jgi:hypothetical protein
VSDSVPDSKANPTAGKLWSLFIWPARILLTGLSILLLAWITTLFHIPYLTQLGAALSGPNILPTIIALLIFIVGLSFAGFLWWVVDRYFSLISSGKLTQDGLSNLKDLPMGLPDGTVRSVLALIVAVVGLPLIAFSEVMHFGSEVAGYLNGIITGVFGFYFGTRSSSATNQAISQITDAKSRADQAEDDRDAAQADAAAAKAQAQTGVELAAAAARAAGFGPAVGKLTRELGVASTILDVIAPALPAGILPAGLSNVVTTAKTALDAVQGVTGNTVSDGQQSMLQNAVGAVLGGGGSSSSLGALLKTAAPMLSGLAVPGVGEVTALVALLSVGMKLGSAEYARWRARVLAAPLAHGLIEFGTVTPDDAHAAMLDSPIFTKAFAQERERPGFDADMADAVLRDDAVDRLWQRYGAASGGKPALFATKAELQSGLTEFQQALLASRAASDMPAGLPDAVTAALTQAKDPDIRSAGTTALTRDGLNQIVNAASKASQPSSAVSTNAHAAFDALVTLVGHARQGGIDLIGALSEVAP